MRGIEARTVLAHSRIAAVLATDAATVEERNAPEALKEFACELAFDLGVADAKKGECRFPAMFSAVQEWVLLYSWKRGHRLGLAALAADK